jgi:hypothetical protein
MNAGVTTRTANTLAQLKRERTTMRKCEKCDEEMNEMFGYRHSHKLEMMGHYCPDCILYIAEEKDGRYEKSRVAGSIEE